MRGWLAAVAAPFFGALLLATSLDAMAQDRRVALVVGNAKYPEAPLRNPVNDARAMAAALRERGFEVLLRENTTRLQLETAVADFGEKLNEGATGLFFYAGHGMQVGGRNYLIPVDAKITTEQRVKLETVDADVVLDQMQAARSKVNMVILDACRNNPFERRFRAIGGGLAQINAPEGTLIAYATAPGKVAADGDGGNGLYTQELLRALRTPGLKVEDVFKQVRINVSRASHGSQTPWEASSLIGDFYFNPDLRPPAPPPPNADALFWGAIKDHNSPSELRAYLEKYPNGEFSNLARLRLEATERAAAERAAAIERAAAAERAAAERIAAEKVAAERAAANERSAAERSAAERAAADKAVAEKATEVAFWSAIKAHDNPAELRAYLTRYPKGEFASLAQLRLEAIEKAKVAAAVPRVTEAPSRPVHEAALPGPGAPLSRGRFDGQYTAAFTAVGPDGFARLNATIVIAGGMIVGHAVSDGSADRNQAGSCSVSGRLELESGDLIHLGFSCKTLDVRFKGKFAPDPKSGKIEGHTIARAVSDGRDIPVRWVR